jgi:hypothetical protein
LPADRRTNRGGDRPRHIWYLEGDLVIGASNASAAVTIVDRATRCSLLGAMPDGSDA